MTIMREQLTFDDVQIEPQYSEIESRSECDTTSRLTRNINLGIPLLAAPMDTVCGYDMVMKLSGMWGLGCLHRFMSVEEQMDVLIKLRNHHTSGAPLVATIGATGDYKDRFAKSLAAGANIFLIDVAHGDHIHVRRAIEWLNNHSERDRFSVIAGNVATAEGAQRLQYWGADAIRVGVGGGSMCETRVRTGIGVPQLSAIMEVADAVDIPIIADGGIRYPGDVAKALAAGANTVMVGSLFAGTTEAPGDSFITGQWPNEKRMKVFRGSASAAAKQSVNGSIQNVEGTATMIPAKGSVVDVINTIMDGVRSSMSYVGARNLDEFRQKAKFVRITPAGLTEAHPHGLR
jgi:IMP dehydrogenase